MSPMDEREPDQVIAKFGKVLWITDSSWFEATPEPGVGPINIRNIRNRLDREGIHEREIGELWYYEFHKG